MQINQKKTAKKREKERAKREKMRDDDRLDRRRMRINTLMMLRYQLYVRLYDSIIMELLFIIPGILGTAWVFYQIYLDSRREHPVIIACIFAVVCFFVIMLCVEIHRRLFLILINTVKIGNYQYEFYRYRLRKHTGDYSIGMGANPTKSIYYFINKDKPGKEFDYIKD